MKYMGGKFKLRDKILPIILQNRKSAEQLYIEPFCGGCNTLAYVNGNRIGNDINFYLIEMWKALQQGWIPNEFYTKDEYIDIRDNKQKYEPHIVGWVGFNCSYKGKFFNGYSGISKTKVNTIRNYQNEAFNAVMKQIHLMQNVKFLNINYYDLIIPNNSVVYCDPPYENTTNYKIDKFDHNKFWDWARFISLNNDLYVSEYNAPNDFECIFEYLQTSMIRSDAVPKVSIEKLFKYKG